MFFDGDTQKFFRHFGEDVVYQAYYGKPPLATGDSITAKGIFDAPGNMSLIYGTLVEYQETYLTVALSDFPVMNNKGKFTVRGKDYSVVEVKEDSTGTLARVQIAEVTR